MRLRLREEGQELTHEGVAKDKGGGRGRRLGVLRTGDLD